MTTSISIQSLPADIYPDPDVDLTIRVDAVARGQLIDVPAGRYDWIRLDLERSGGQRGELEDTVWLHYRDGVDREWLRVPANAHTCRIPVPRHTTLIACRLPDRDGLWVRGFTLVPSEPALAAPSTPEPVHTGTRSHRTGDDQQ